MNHASHWRQSLARQSIAPAYAALDGVEAIALVGDSARGLADGWSDLDLVVFWRQAPSLETRAQIVEALGGRAWVVDDAALRRPDLALQHRDETWWLPGGTDAALKVDVRHTLCIAMDRLLADVVERQQPDRLKLAQLGSIQQALPLHGADRIAGWAEGAGRCPEAIARRLVEDNLRLFAPWTFEMLAEREDGLLYARNLADTLERMLLVLHGLNRSYPPLSPGHLAATVATLPLAPTDFARRATALLAARPIDASRRLGLLATELYDLVDARMPGLDTRPARGALAGRRPRLVDSPIPLG